MHRVTVGEPYLPGQESWPEAIDINPREAGMESRLFLPHLTGHEIEQFSHGTIQGAIYDNDGVLIVCLKYGELPWMDCAVEFLNMPPTDRLDLQIVQPHHLRMTHILIDAASGIVRGVRETSLSPAFTERLISNLLQQAKSESPTSPQRLKWTLEAYESKQLVELASIREVLG